MSQNPPLPCPRLNWVRIVILLFIYWLHLSRCRLQQFQEQHKTVLSQKEMEIEEMKNRSVLFNILIYCLKQSLYPNGESYFRFVPPCMPPNKCYRAFSKLDSTSHFWQVSGPFADNYDIYSHSYLPYRIALTKEAVPIKV